MQDQLSIATRTFAVGRELIHSAASFITLNALFLGLLVAGTVLRILTMMAYQPIFMLQKDTYTYLRLAVAPELPASGFRPVLYSLALKPLLALGGLEAVAFTQHLLGLVLAVGLYALLRKLEVSAVVAALGTAPLLLDGYQVAVEHYLLTEVLFDALIVAGFILLAWRARPSIPSVGGAGLLLGLAVLTRYAGVVLVVPAVLYVLVRGLGWWRVATLAVAFAVPLALYSSWFQSEAGVFALTNRNGFFLYGRVASFADCSGVELSRRLRRFCLEEPVESNFGIWTLDLPIRRLIRKPNANALLLEFSRRMILTHPVDYTGVVMGDFLRFFHWRSPPDQEPYVHRWRFPRAIRDARPNPYVQARGGSAPASTGFESFSIDRPLAEKLRAYQTLFYTPGPLLALLVLLGGAGCILGAPLRSGRNLRAECLLFTTSGVLLLLFPVMTTVYHYRYVMPMLPLLGTAGAIGATAIWQKLRDDRRPRGEADADPAS